MVVDASLAHAQLLGQGREREPVVAVLGDDPHGLADDLLGCHDAIEAETEPLVYRSFGRIPFFSPLRGPFPSIALATVGGDG